MKTHLSSVHTAATSWGAYWPTLKLLGSSSSLSNISYLGKAQDTYNEHVTDTMYNSNPGRIKWYYLLD